ncbi:MAG: hypothetical protein ACAI25_20430, partial [Planctomycetota bacterium]
MALLLPAVLAGLVLAAVVKPDLYTQAAAWLREKLLEGASGAQAGFVGSLLFALAMALNFAAPANDVGPAGGEIAAQAQVAKVDVHPNDIHVGGPYPMPGPPPFVHDDSKLFKTVTWHDETGYHAKRVPIGEIRPTTQQQLPADVRPIGPYHPSKLPPFIHDDKPLFGTIVVKDENGYHLQKVPAEQQRGAETQQGTQEEGPG